MDESTRRVSAQHLPMLTVEALPADCSPLNSSSTTKLGDMLSTMLAAIYTENE